PRLVPLPRVATYPADYQEELPRFLLGWKLFYDPILSGSRDVACATCHHPAFGMSDGRAVSLGIEASGLGPGRRPNGSFDASVTRNAQSIVNAAFMPALFWDGRVRTLEEQSLVPLASQKEMRADAFTEASAVDSVLRRLRAIGLYERDFRAAFP